MLPIEKLMRSLGLATQYIARDVAGLLVDFPDKFADIGTDLGAHITRLFGAGASYCDDSVGHPFLLCPNLAELYDLLDGECPYDIAGPDGGDVVDLDTDVTGWVYAIKPVFLWR